MAKTGAKSNKKAPIEHVNAGRDGTAWFNRYSQKNSRRSARKEPRFNALVPVSRKVAV